ncbi:glycine oxidase ThiO [Halotia wernerae UHCC 0503]|nr:glycine oxidase ThiO [Halotia wernerae UHCC 0503]
MVNHCRNPASDVLIVGGGIVGLGIAIELALEGVSVKVLSRSLQESATYAAAGMLAPQVDSLPSKAMVDLCLRSNVMYPAWIEKLEELSQLESGYWPCGVLAPVYVAPKDEMKRIEFNVPTAQWLNQDAVHQKQPGLSPEVVGGWWHPEEGQVDNRALAQTMRKAAYQLSVSIHDGVVVESIQQNNGEVTSIKTCVGNFQSGHYILATGAWSSELLPVSVYPKKGQMLSFKTPFQSAGNARNTKEEMTLRVVLFGHDIYIVPRQDGRILIGATSEEVGFTNHNTPAGIQQLLERAIRLYPKLQNYTIEESWWGFRPATPDELPILGQSHLKNLTLAIGHYRNGILLAPVTASLIADLILHHRADALLKDFCWERFHSTQNVS